MRSGTHTGRRSLTELFVKREELEQAFDSVVTGAARLRAIMELAEFRPSPESVVVEPVSDWTPIAAALERAIQPGPWWRMEAVCLTLMAMLEQHGFQLSTNMKNWRLSAQTTIAHSGAEYAGYKANQEAITNNNKTDASPAKGLRSESVRA